MFCCSSLTSIELFKTFQKLGKRKLGVILSKKGAFVSKTSVRIQLWKLRATWTNWLVKSNWPKRNVLCYLHFHLLTLVILVFSLSRLNFVFYWTLFVACPRFRWQICRNTNTYLTMFWFLTGKYFWKQPKCLNLPIL